MNRSHNDSAWLQSLRQLRAQVAARGVALDAVPATLCLLRAVLAIAAESDDLALRRELAAICTDLNAACRATAELERLRVRSDDRGHDVRH
ncbi:hypothetical protein FBR04_20465 [Betaproteobacteria bacterium PRO7]|jgi:hypothetical protein|nr:hypothetical protein [Betaproteobacteria bacterium PRO7]